MSVSIDIGGGSVYKNGFSYNSD